MKEILVFFEVELHARNLIQEFRKALLGTPEFKSAIAIMWMSGDTNARANGVKFRKGSDEFELADRVVTPEREELVLSVDSNGISEKVRLVSEKRDGGGLIEYAIHSLFEHPPKAMQKDSFAIDGAKNVLRKLRHRPLLSFIK